jgi:hypothetical protein
MQPWIAPELQLELIHRLFGIGIHLQGTAGLVADEAIDERLRMCIDELDSCTRLVRGLIRPDHQ